MYEFKVKFFKGLVSVNCLDFEIGVEFDTNQRANVIVRKVYCTVQYEFEMVLRNLMFEWHMSK